MQLITPTEFHTICHQPENILLKTTYDRPKMFETPDGMIIKVFYPRKKRYSSNSLKPYALRFCQNAERLRSLGFNTPIIHSIQHCAELHTYVIAYKKLHGQDARVLAQQDRTIIDKVAAYIGDLHNQGIFFRSLHLENLLYDYKTFSLLDIVDVQFKKKSLSFFLRYRNLKHMFRILDDRKFWKQFGIKPFLDIYFKNTNISVLSKKCLSTLLIQSCS